jgi:hypothetical protein
MPPKSAKAPKPPKPSRRTATWDEFVTYVATFYEDELVPLFTETTSGQNVQEAIKTVMKTRALGAHFAPLLFDNTDIDTPAKNTDLVKGNGSSVRLQTDIVYTWYQTVSAREDVVDNIPVKEDLSCIADALIYYDASLRAIGNDAELVNKTKDDAIGIVAGLGRMVVSDWWRKIFLQGFDMEPDAVKLFEAKMTKNEINAVALVSTFIKSPEKAYDQAYFRPRTETADDTVSSDTSGQADDDGMSDDEKEESQVTPASDIQDGTLSSSSIAGSSTSVGWGLSAIGQGLTSILSGRQTQPKTPATNAVQYQPEVPVVQDFDDQKMDAEVGVPAPDEYTDYQPTGEETLPVLVAAARAAAAEIAKIRLPIRPKEEGQRAPPQNVTKKGFNALREPVGKLTVLLAEISKRVKAPTDDSAGVAQSELIQQLRAEVERLQVQLADAVAVHVREEKQIFADIEQFEFDLGNTLGDKLVAPEDIKNLRKEILRLHVEAQKNQKSAVLIQGLTGTLAEFLTGIRDAVKGLRAEKDQAVTKARDATQLYAKTQKQLEDASAAYKILDDQKSWIDKKAQQSAIRITQLQEQIQGLQDTGLNGDAQLTLLRQQRDTAIAERDALQREENHWEEEVTNLNAKLRESQTRLGEKDAELQKTYAVLKKQQQDVQGMKKEYDRLVLELQQTPRAETETVHILQSAIEALQTQLAEAKASRTNLEIQLGVAQDAYNQSQADLDAYIEHAKRLADSLESAENQMKDSDTAHENELAILHEVIALQDNQIDSNSERFAREQAEILARHQAQNRDRQTAEIQAAIINQANTSDATNRMQWHNNRLVPQDSAFAARLQNMAPGRISNAADAIDTAPSYFTKSTDGNTNTYRGNDNNDQEARARLANAGNVFDTFASDINTAIDAPSNSYSRSRLANDDTVEPNLLENTIAWFVNEKDRKQKATAALEVVDTVHFLITSWARPSANFGPVLTMKLRVITLALFDTVGIVYKPNKPLSLRPRVALQYKKYLGPDAEAIDIFEPLELLVGNVFPDQYNSYDDVVDKAQSIFK